MKKHRITVFKCPDGTGKKKKKKKREPVTDSQRNGRVQIKQNFLNKKQNIKIVDILNIPLEMQRCQN